GCAAEIYQPAHAATGPMNEAQRGGDTPAYNSFAVAFCQARQHLPRPRGSRLGRMRQERLGHSTKWKENAFGKWKLLPRLGDDARVSGSQRLSQKPLALPLRVDVRRIEKGYSGIYCS